MVTLLAFVLPLAGSAAPPAQQITVEAFWEQIDATLALVESYPDTHSAKWLMESKRWAAISEISIPGQSNMPIDTGPIVRMLNADPPERAELIAYLTGLKRTRGISTQPDGAAESERLRQILARPEFQAEPEEMNIFDRVLRWLANAYNRLVNLLVGDRQGSGAIPSNLVMVVTGVLLIAVLGYVFRDSLRNLFNEVELAEEPSGEGEILSSRLANQRARELSSGGDYRHALRYLYLSALLLLDERGLLRYNRAQTNREYLRQVRSRPELAGHLKEVVDTFDRVWYGFQPLDEAEYQKYAEHVTALEETKE